MSTRRMLIFATALTAVGILVYTQLRSTDRDIKDFRTMSIDRSREMREDEDNKSNRRMTAIDATDVKERIRVLAIEGTNENRAEITRLVLTLVKSDTKAALESMSSLPDDFGTWVFVEIHRMLVERDPKACEEWLSAFKPQSDVQRRMMANIFGFLCAQNLDSALAALDAVDPGERLSLLKDGVATWTTKTDPESALISIRGHLEGEELQATTSAIICRIALDDSKRAFGLAMEQDPESKGKIIPEILSTMNEKGDFKNLREALAQLDSSSLGKVLDHRSGRSQTPFISILAKRDPELSISVLSRVVQTSENLDMFESAAQQMATLSPERSKEWAASYPEGPARTRMLAGTYLGWLEKSVEGARLSFEELDQGAVIPVFSAIAEQDGKKASMLIDGMRDDQKVDAIKELERFWKAQDPEAFEAWLAKNLPDK